MKYNEIEQFDIKEQVVVDNNNLGSVLESKLRIYAIVNLLNNIYFDDENKINKYIRHNMKNVGEKVVIDYLGRMAGRVDVIRVIYSDNSVKYFSEENDLGYMIYDYEKSVSTGEDVWVYEYGNLKDIYDELKKRGIKLENDVYGRQDELYSSVSSSFIEPLKRK